MTYNLTLIGSNSTGLLPFVQMINSELMYGTLGIFFLLAFSTICLTSWIFITGDLQKSILGTTFIAFTLSIFLLAMNLVPFLVMILCLIASALAFGFSYLDR